MRLGRDFTNLLYFEYLSEEDKQRLRAGEIAVPDMDAMVQVTAKADIARQVSVAKSLGLDHVELDGAVPNSYLEFTDEAKREAREFAIKHGITLSLHLPYSYVGASVCAPEELDRQAAAGLQKRYVEFASEIGCKYCVLHPGVVPFYHATGRYFEQVEASLVKTVLELGGFASQHGVELLLENNTAFDNVFVEPQEICKVLEKVRENGVKVHFNFDIGHWFTRADVGREIPNPPEKIIEEIPSGLFKELHLNDYIPGKRVFHPLLHDQIGLLKRENLERYAELVAWKGAELIVVETAIKTREQVLQRDEILRKETEYLKSIFG